MEALSVTHVSPCLGPRLPDAYHSNHPFGEPLPPRSHNATRWSGRISVFRVALIGSERLTFPPSAFYLACFGVCAAKIGNDACRARCVSAANRCGTYRASGAERALSPLRHSRTSEVRWQAHLR